MIKNYGIMILTAIPLLLDIIRLSNNDCGLHQNIADYKKI